MTYYLEIFELGLWETVDQSDSFKDIVELASSFCANYPEDRIRIYTNHGNIL